MVANLSPSLIVEEAVEMEYVAPFDVSKILTEAVLPTWVDLDESEKSLILRVSVPSVVKSFARVWEKDKSPLLSTVPDPVKAPEEKSSLDIPVPLSDQYNVVPLDTLLVLTFEVSVLPSLMEVLDVERLYSLSSSVIVTVAVPSLICAGTVSELEAVIDNENVSLDSASVFSIDEIEIVLDDSPAEKDILWLIAV